MNKENIVQLKNISVAFDDQVILDNLSLDIKDKEFITFLGPSGCGKTTTLRLIAGFLEPDEGDVLFEGNKINGVPAYKRQVNTIFQRYALFPHLNGVLPRRKSLTGPPTISARYPPFSSLSNI